MKTFEAYAWSSITIFDEGFRFEIEAFDLAEATKKFGEIAKSHEWEWRKLFLERIEDKAVRVARCEAYMAELVA